MSLLPLPKRRRSLAAGDGLGLCWEILRIFDRSRVVQVQDLKSSVMLLFHFIFCMCRELKESIASGSLNVVRVNTSC